MPMTAQDFQALIREGVDDGNRNTPRIYDVMAFLSLRGCPLGRYRSEVARACLAYFEGDFFSDVRRDERIGFQLCVFLLNTRLLIYSAPLREAIIRRLDAHFQSGDGYCRIMTDLASVVIREAKERRPQYYSVRVKSRPFLRKMVKRVPHYKAQPWAVAFEQRWPASATHPAGS